MKRILVAVAAVVALAAVARGQSTVSSYTVPNLVAEINTALANPVHTSAEVNGDLTLAQDETIDNATDAKVRVTFDDDAAVLGEFILESDNAAANVSANDSISVIGKAYDATTAKTEFASMDFVFTDPTGASEDGAVDLNVFVGGTERKLARFAAATVIGAAQATLALTSSDWAIGATGDATGLGAITADGAVDFQSTLDVDGAMTATNITLDAGAKLIGTTSLTLGNGAETVSIDSSDWDISTTGDMTGIGSITADGEASIDGKYAVVGGDATTGLMILKANVTAGTNATETVTFGTVFGAAPTVVCTYTEDPGDVKPIFVTSVTASNFVANITADMNYGYIAVGTRP